MFQQSSTPDITETLPFLLSSRQVSSNVIQGGVKNAVVLSGVAFQILGLASQTPMLRPKMGRLTIPVQKQQFDSSKEPGEHSLDGYWLRSQTSWHLGAGINYYEPGDVPETQYRFLTSLGVDVWTLDQVSLLKRTNLQKSAVGTSYVASAVDSAGNDLLLYSSGGVLTKLTTAGVATNYTTANAPASRIAVGGAKILFGHAAGIDVVDITGTTSAALHTQAAGVVPTPYWVKSRIIASRNNSLFELTLAAAVNLDTATPLWTHPDASWVWTSVTEGPGSILAAGYGSGVSAIYRFALQDANAGQTPKLSQAYQIAELPPGEAIQTIKSYLGQYIGVATTAGLRVGVIGGGSGADTVTLGPLLFKSTSPVAHIAARGSYLYAGVTNDHPDGMSGLVRVDLSQPIGSGNSLRFPYAWDAQTGQGGQVTSVSTFGTTDRMALCVSGLGVYVQSATDYVDSGYLTSGRIRYSTVQPKAFFGLDLRADVTSGRVSVSTIEPSGSEVLEAVVDASSGGQVGVGLNSSNRVEFLSYKTTLTRTAPTLTPVVQSIQLRAWPAPTRLRKIVWAVQVFDFERDANGVRFGYDGFAWDRIRSLEAIEETSSIVQATDLTTGETFTCVIESLDLTRTEAPDGPYGNFGGFLEITVRKM